MGVKWAEMTVGQFSPFSYGKNLPAEKRRPGNFPVVSSAGVSGAHDEPFVTTKGIVIGRKGTVGSLTYCDNPFWPIDTAFFIADEPDVRDLRFTFYLLHTLNLTNMNSDSAVPGLNRDNAHARKVLVPPLAEQKAIAAVLGALDDKIELNRRMNATLEAMARALFQSWFVDFDPVRAKLDGRKPVGLDPATTALFPDHLEDSPLGQIPKGWKVGKIQDCCVQIQNGGTPRRNEPRFWDGGNVPWLASGEVRQSIITATESFITDDGLAESSAKWVPAFSTVVALYGATAGQVSFTSSRLTTNQAVCALIPKKGFAYFNYLTMRGATAELENKAVGSAQQNISKAIVEETKVILPPAALVERHATLVSPLFDQWISNLHQSRTLATLRDTLLPKLLNGDLQVAKISEAA
jgi:type I restriction enzyme, S subunit